MKFDKKLITGLVAGFALGTSVFFACRHDSASTEMSEVASITTRVSDMFVPRLFAATTSNPLQDNRWSWKCEIAAVGGGVIPNRLNEMQAVPGSVTLSTLTDGQVLFCYATPGSRPIVVPT